MIPDTVTVQLRSENSPFTVLDSARGLLSSSGTASLIFNNVADDQTYYVVLKHRNSIETWSNSPQGPFRILTSQSNYSFTFSASAAFGNNLKQVDQTPFTFAIYGGDIDQDGIIDGSDLSLITNDAFNFTTGYVLTDRPVYLVCRRKRCNNCFEQCLRFRRGNQALECFRPLRNVESGRVA